MLNKGILIGYVGTDSEMKFTPGGTPVANFSLAVKEAARSGNGDQSHPRFLAISLMGMDWYWLLSQECNQLSAGSGNRAQP
jgi:single-stranded DNA-binding protein